MGLRFRFRSRIHFFVQTWEMPTAVVIPRLQAGAAKRQPSLVTVKVQCCCQHRACYQGAEGPDNTLDSSHSFCWATATLLNLSFWCNQQAYLTSKVKTNGIITNLS